MIRPKILFATMRQRVWVKLWDFVNRTRFWEVTRSERTRIAIQFEQHLHRSDSLPAGLSREITKKIQGQSRISTRDNFALQMIISPSMISHRQLFELFGTVNLTASNMELLRKLFWHHLCQAQKNVSVHCAKFSTCLNKFILTLWLTIVSYEQA